MEGQLASEDYLIGIYDYIHLGVLYLELEEFDKAKEYFEKAGGVQ